MIWKKSLFEFPILVQRINDVKAFAIIFSIAVDQDVIKPRSLGRRRVLYGIADVYAFRFVWVSKMA